MQNYLIDYKEQLFTRQPLFNWFSIHFSVFNHVLNSFNHYNSIDNYDNYDTIAKCQSFSNQIAITTPFKIQILLLSDECPPGWLNELGSWDYLTTHTILSLIRRGFVPGFANYKKGALDSQPQGIKFTSCLPMVGGSLRVLRLLPPLTLVAMI
jgi:hypothetical protein